MLLFGGMSPKKVQRLIDLLKEHPTIQSLEIKPLFPLFGGAISITVNSSKALVSVSPVPKKPDQGSHPKLPIQASTQISVAPSVPANVVGPRIVMRYPWSPYDFSMSGEVTLVIGDHPIHCVLESIIAPRSGKFYLGKTYDETGKKKKKRGLRSGDLVVTGDRLGTIVYTERWRPRNIPIVAEKLGHLDIPQGIDRAPVKEGDTLMLIAVEKTPEKNL